MSRVLLFTGKGGVGKTTAAAATATLAAGSGHKTLVVSTDTAHSLADALGATAGGEPTEISPGLHLHQVDTQKALERQWGDLRDYARGFFAELGLDEVTAEEITVLPGADEVIALLELREHARSGRWDVIVIDCAPTAETLRLLALPEALDWHVNRLLPVGRRLLRTLSPLIRRVAQVSVPEDHVVGAGERLHRGLLEVRELLTGPDASVRLVLTPEAVVLAEARRTLTSLSLYGYRVDAVIANRVFPAEGADPWRQRWVDAQARHLAEVEQSFAPLPVHIVPYLDAEPVGPAALARVAEAMYGEADPFAPPTVDPPLRITPEGELILALPLAEKSEVDLARKGDELIVNAGSHRRVLALPAALARRSVQEAVLRDGLLRVRFQSGGPDD
ncbi:ArsA family ATPase [Streptosporangium roseum]|uniref:arsenite-transporting ATPase n=1 Tax=Streptosporangium roseum (strain ATCC 12428 / DSM 43021 / JCM 3005 / KCTC 9067 / NCIMB 10171 / NRRL 2505 / NI 9100) TaxID=479432 RepID=D2B4X8_STRRD|nr:ArsA family ATPase [Streptosporangium roseum]ACZ85664.1 Arsenite-transporting ATPase [Streptosporangium roseum DSM 43021]